MAMVSVPSISGEGNLTRYLQEIRKFPMLEPDEEYMLAKRWKEAEDPEAAHRLVTSHLRLVAKIAMGYRGYGLPLSELISEGNVGMMQAVKRFDPDHSLNAPLRSDSEGEWQDWLVDDSESQETMLGERQELGLRRDLLEKAMTHLNDRERHILTERRLQENPTTLEDLSQQYGISRERVRQIEVRAFEKLQKAMKAAAVERRLVTH